MIYKHIYDVPYERATIPTIESAIKVKHLIIIGEIGTFVAK